MRTAIEFARRQSAKSPGVSCDDELRTVAREAGRRDEALAMLAEIYGSFTEGFDARDLKGAKA